MQQVTIGTKNQIVIPKEVRNKIPGLKPGTVVSVYQLDKDTVAIKVSEQNWVEETYGLFREQFEKTGVLEQIEKMRDEWER